MSIIRVKVVAGANNSSETINQLTVDGTGWATSATLNLQNGTIGSYVGEGTQLVANNLGTLSTTGVTHDFWAVSNLTASVITFKVKVGEYLFKVNTPAAVTLERGRVYTYVLNVENLNGASLASVSTKDWISEDVVNFDTNVMTFADFMHEKFQGITTDGVYAVKSDGTPVAYAEASDASYSAVAFVIKGKAYQVAKADATGYNGSSGVYWQKTGYSDISGLTNYTTADGTNDSGYLTVTSGTQLSKDPSTWGDGALGDFNGQANTATILAAQNNGADNYTFSKAIMDFRSGSNNEGKEDWFAPSCGELAYMFLMKTKLNTLLGKVSGSEIYDGYYWTSTEYSSGFVWVVRFSNGRVGFTYKSDNASRLRLIRAI